MENPNSPQSLGEQAQDALEKAKGTVQNAANQITPEIQHAAAKAQQTVQATVSQVSSDAERSAADARRAMRENAYTVKETASDSLLNAAESIRREALKNGSEEVVRQAHQVARSLEKAALYLDSHTFDQISTDATEVVKQNPWQSVGVVFVLGLLLGMLFGGGRD